MLGLGRARPPRTRKPWLRQLRYRGERLWHDVVSQHDAPHRIALGVALGIVVGWLPIVGVQMFLCILLCWLLRANFLATLPGVWLSNPLTMVPMYWLENRVGAFIAGEAITLGKMQRIWGRIGDLIEQHGFWSGTWEGTALLFTDFLPVTVAMFIGGGLIGVVNALLLYYPSLRLVERYHERRRVRKAGWLERWRLRRDSAGEPQAPPPSADQAPGDEPPAGDDVHPDKEAV